MAERRGAECSGPPSTRGRTCFMQATQYDPTGLRAHAYRTAGLRRFPATPTASRSLRAPLHRCATNINDGSMQPHCPGRSARHEARRSTRRMSPGTRCQLASTIRNANDQHPFPDLEHVPFQRGTERSSRSAGSGRQAMRSGPSTPRLPRQLQQLRHASAAVAATPIGSGNNDKPG